MILIFKKAQNGKSKVFSRIFVKLNSLSAKAASKAAKSMNV